MGCKNSWMASNTWFFYAGVFFPFFSETDYMFNRTEWSLKKRDILWFVSNCGNDKTKRMEMARSIEKASSLRSRQILTMMTCAIASHKYRSNLSKEKLQNIKLQLLTSSNSQLKKMARYFKFPKDILGMFLQFFGYGKIALVFLE